MNINLIAQTLNQMRKDCYVIGTLRAIERFVDHDIYRVFDKKRRIKSRPGCKSQSNHQVKPVDNK